jgi:hypothetical protein
MKVRAIALTTSALVAVAALAAPASAGEYVGKINLGAGYTWDNYENDGDEFEANFSAIHGSGSVNVPYNDVVNLQLDVFSAASMENQGDGADNYYGGSGLGVHLNYRDAQGALGVFGTVGRANDGAQEDGNHVVFAAGFEGQYFANEWTLRAQTGWLDSDDQGELFQQAGFIDLGADYYASSKLKLSGSVGYMDGEKVSSTTDVYDATHWNWVLGVEYLFGKSVPVSTYLEYRGQNTEITDGGETAEIDTHALNVGVRFYFGGSSDLMKADREGAGMTNQDIITRPRAEPTPGNK